MSTDRFEHIVSFIPQCELLAEIGCDHAYLTECAFRHGKCRSAIVSDISAKCLDKARVTLRGRDNVTFLAGGGVVTDGREPDVLLICGMGGHTIRDILAPYDGSATLVLSPQSHAELVRGALVAKGYAISADECFKSEGKYYDVIRAERGERELTEMQIKYGAYYTRRNAALRERTERLLADLSKGGEANAARIREATEVLKWQE